MDPRAVLHPVGPLPARVYWLRRLIPLGVALVLILIVAVSCSGGGGKHPMAGAHANSTVSPSPSAPSSSASVEPCHVAGLDVTATTDATKYAAGVLPHLTVSVRNTGLTACAFQDAPSRRIWTIVSGNDQVWTTAGCASSKLVVRRVLAGGQSLRHSLVWNRHRTGPNCATSDTSADPGTYQLLVTVDGVHSAPAVFHLTG